MKDKKRLRRGLASHVILFTDQRFQVF